MGWRGGDQKSTIRHAQSNARQVLPAKSLAATFPTHLKSRFKNISSCLATVKSWVLLDQRLRRLKHRLPGAALGRCEFALDCGGMMPYGRKNLYVAHPTY